MLSGVGDEHHLKAHGIAPVRHSPQVGEGLAARLKAPALPWDAAP